MDEILKNYLEALCVLLKKKDIYTELELEKIEKNIMHVGSMTTYHLLVKMGVLIIPIF